MNTSDLIVITGAGGFIGGSLARYVPRARILPHPGRGQEAPVGLVPAGPGRREPVPGRQREENCVRVCEGAVEVYNLAADMGGMGFIERFRVECLRSILINTHMLEAAWRAGVETILLLLLGLRVQHRPPEGYRTRRPSRNPTPTRPWPSGATAGKSSCPRCSVRNTGRSAASRPSSPASTTSTAPTAPGTAAAKRRPRPSAARSSRPRTRAGTGSRSGATARRPAASCTSTIASRAST